MIKLTRTSDDKIRLQTEESTPVYFTQEKFDQFMDACVDIISRSQNEVTIETEE